jgi:hypothetical protein
MAGVYCPRHPDRTVLYLVLFHHFDRFLAEYEGCLEKEYGFFRPIVKEVVERIDKVQLPDQPFAFELLASLRDLNLALDQFKNRVFLTQTFEDVALTLLGMHLSM